MKKLVKKQSAPSTRNLLGAELDNVVGGSFNFNPNLNVGPLTIPTNLGGLPQMPNFSPPCPTCW